MRLSSRFEVSLWWGLLNLDAGGQEEVSRLHLKPAENRARFRGYGRLQAKSCCHGRRCRRSIQPLTDRKSIHYGLEACGGPWRLVSCNQWVRIGIGGVINCPSVRGRTSIERTLCAYVGSEVADSGPPLRCVCRAGRWTISQRAKPHSDGATEGRCRTGLCIFGNCVVPLSIRLHLEGVIIAIPGRSGCAICGLGCGIVPPKSGFSRLI